MHLHIPINRVYKSLVDIMIKIIMTPHEMTNNLNHSFWKFKILSYHYSNENWPEMKVAGFKILNNFRIQTFSSFQWKFWENRESNTLTSLLSTLSLSSSSLSLLCFCTTKQSSSATTPPAPAAACAVTTPAATTTLRPTPVHECLLLHAPTNARRQPHTAELPHARSWPRME